MSKSTDRIVIAIGSYCAIVYAMRSNGTMPSKVFIENLEPKEQYRINALFQRMADFGKINNTAQFKKLDGKIFEFKRNQHRICCFLVDNQWRLTHGFIKKTQKCPKSQMKRANDIMEEDLAHDISKGRGKT